MDVTRRQVTSVDQQLSQLMQVQIRENREKMKFIVKTVIFCGYNNILLRGKREDCFDDQMLQGNFQALFDFSVDSGDEKLKQHLEKDSHKSRVRWFSTMWKGYDWPIGDERPNRKVHF